MKRLLSLVETTAAIILLLIALLTASNVFLRELLGTTMPDWFDGSRLLLGVAMFWGIAIATYHAGHICVDVVWEVLSPTNRRRLDIVASLLTLLFLLPLAWMIWIKVGGTGSQVTSDLRLPIVWFYVASALGAVVASVLAVMRVIELILGQDNAEELPHGS